MTRRPGYVLSIIVLAAAAAAAVCGCSPSDDDATTAAASDARPVVRVAVAPVRRGDVTATLELVGNLFPRRRTVIVAEVDGVIAEIPPPKRNPIVVDVGGQKATLPLDIGSEVGKDDLLLKLDASDYERALKVSQAQLAKLKADLAQLLAWQRPEEVARTQALYDEAEANLNRAELDFERMKSLRDQNAISQSEFEEKRMQWLGSRAMLAHAKANLDMANGGPTDEQIEVAKAAIAAAEAEVDHKRWKVEKTCVHAPYDAVITDRYVDVGDRVTALPRVEIMELMDVSLLVAEVGVPEKYSGKVHNLDRADVLVQGRADPVPGVVVRINGKIDAGSRTFRIRVGIMNDQREFRVGQFARVLLDVATSENALTVPRRALTYAGGQPQVFVCQGERVELRPVTLGIANEETVEVLSGLQEGQQVVTDDPAVLTDGMQVELAPQSAARVAESRPAP